MCFHYAREFFTLTTYPYWYLYQYSVFYISTLLNTIFAWFISSEFKWLRFVAGSRYLQGDGVGEVGVLDKYVRGAFWVKRFLP